MDCRRLGVRWREADWQWELGVPLSVVSCHCRYRVFSASAWVTLLTLNTVWLSVSEL